MSKFGVKEYISLEEKAKKLFVEMDSTQDPAWEDQPEHIKDVWRTKAALGITTPEQQPMTITANLSFVVHGEKVGAIDWFDYLRMVCEENDLTIERSTINIGYSEKAIKIKDD